MNVGVYASGLQIESPNFDKIRVILVKSSMCVRISFCVPNQLVECNIRMHLPMSSFTRSDNIFKPPDFNPVQGHTNVCPIVEMSTSSVQSDPGALFA